MCKPTIRQWRIGHSCTPPPSPKGSQNVTKMLNIWTKATLVVQHRCSSHTHSFPQSHTHTCILMSICSLYREDSSCFVIWSRHQHWSHIMTSDLSGGITNTWGKARTSVQYLLNSTDFRFPLTSAGWFKPSAYMPGLNASPLAHTLLVYLSAWGKNQIYHIQGPHFASRLSARKAASIPQHDDLRIFVNVCQLPSQNTHVRSCSGPSHWGDDPYLERR